LEATSADGPADELISKLLQWVEGSGRAIELRGERTLRDGGAGVRSSVSYIDVVTKLARETDVVADFGWVERLDAATGDLPCSLTAVVECKSSKKHPWVAFAGGGQRADIDSLDDWLSFAHAPYTPVSDRLPRVWVGEEPFTIAKPATHVVAARLGQAKDDSTESNPAGDAVRQVLAAAEGLRMEYINRQAREKRGLFIAPVVVTAAPLFTCHLADDSSIDLQPTDRVDVWGYRADGRRARVYVMTETHLSTSAHQLQLQAMRASN
jgi:hypothetical protein